MENCFSDSSLCTFLHVVSGASADSFRRKDVRTGMGHVAFDSSEPSDAACVLAAVSTRKERVQEKTFLLFKGYASSDSWLRMPFQRDKLFFGFDLSASSFSGVSGSVGRNLSL